MTGKGGSMAISYADRSTPRPAARTVARGADVAPARRAATVGSRPAVATDLRIALFSGNYNYVRDGANQALNRLVAHLLAQGIAVRVYSPTTASPAFAPAGDLVSAPSFAFPGGRGEYRMPVGLSPAVKRDLAAFAPNIVHVSSPDPLGHAAIRWARRHGVKVVASQHTRFETYPRYYRMGFLARPLEWMQTRFYNRADRVLAPGEPIAAMLRDWGVTTPIDQWVRGTDHVRFNPGRRSVAWRESLGIGPDDFTVGFLGRLVLEKGLDIFAEVAIELTRRGVPHKVLVIGDGPARDWFADHVPGAVFAGFQSGDALGRAVASLDVFFNPSVTESFSNVALEAMAAGVPVVGADAIGQIGIVIPGKTGFLVPPRSVTAYADAIEQLAHDPALHARMGAAGHAAALGYEWPRVNDAVIAAYLATLAG